MRGLAAAGLDPADPGLRPTGIPGQYASSVALGRPRAAEALTTTLAAEPWIEKSEITGPGYLTITVTPEALAALPGRIADAGLACATSEALRGVTVPAPPAGDPLDAASWEEARRALAAQLTARLAAAAGAMVAGALHPERTRGASRDATKPAAAVAFAGADAVQFALARAVPGRPVRIDPAVLARHVQDNPAYAVRYAHARAASGVRWAATSNVAEAAPPRSPADPGELALLDALSWLPERVAVAARRARPDEFARYLEDLASVCIKVLASPAGARAPGSDKLALATAARTGLAAGLGLLGIGAPDRL